MKQSGHIFYISHGGGPMPLLGDPDHKEMVTTLQTMAQKIGKPSAIVVVSAHWEASLPTVTSAPAPKLIYDYGGFPKEAYDIQYPCPGEPELAKRIHDVLSNAGITACMDDQRGLDHGLFVPVKIMYPEADIPCIQLSLVHSLDADLHIEIGKALQGLEWDNLLIIGSGFSFHNLRAFFSPNPGEMDVGNQAFEKWLRQVVTDKRLSENERTHRLINWEVAPYARYCHPREEHLLPLHICYGMAGKASDECYEIEIMKKQSSMFFWEHQNLSSFTP